ncbi:LuxR C-terminal-related transcriptional regulator [Serratia sp. L9]
MITDIELQGDDVFLLLKKIKRDNPEIKSLFFSSKNESIYSLRALEAKANGFISKDRELDEILFAAKHVLNGYLFFPSDILNSISGLANLGESATPSHTLTAREISVLSYLIKGFKNKEIAQVLFISSKTVSTYKTRIMAKLGVKSVIEMANYVTKNNLL